MSNYTDTVTTTTIKQAIDGFLLNCKVEGKAWGTIACYEDKLKGFLLLVLTLALVRVFYS